MNSYFIDEEHSRHKFSDSLVDVLVHDLVDFSSQLLGDLSFLWLRYLSQERDEIMPALRSAK
jgi:hypothetical protein